MPGTAVNWRVAGRVLGEGQLWGNLAIPAAGARLTLHTDGTPESVANPNAKHLGGTKAGAKLMVKAERQDYFIDEQIAPVDSIVTKVESVISCELVGVSDIELAEMLTPGIGTKATGAGYEQLKFGQRADVYMSIALIFPLREDPSKFGVWHLYKAINDTGLEFGVSKKEMGFTPVNFRSYAITTRAADDMYGSFWKMTST